jgi:hypothetical protein
MGFDQLSLMGEVDGLSFNLTDFMFQRSHHDFIEVTAFQLSENLT